MNLSKYTHIIWDWNGTLIDDTWVCAEIVSVCLERRGLKVIDIDVYKDLYELPVVNFYKKIGFGFTEDEFKELSEEFLAIYDERQFECSLHEGAVEALEFFDKQGIGQSILSAYQQHRLEKALNHFGIIDYFRHVVGRKDPLASGKEELAQELIGKLDFNNSSLLFIGDTTHDFEVAKAQHADCVLISGGHYSKQRLYDSKATVFGSILQLLEVN
jgi:phosphoglycolate phosphatase